MLVYVLLFNAGTESEGIHTLEMGDRHKILMFKSEDDAARYSLLLEAQDFPPLTVEAIDSQEIEEFCLSANYDWELIDDTTLAIPPETNKEQTLWDAQQQEQAPSETTEESNPELEALRRRLEGLL